MDYFIDELAKQLSGGLSRRQALLRIMQGGLGVLIGSLGLPRDIFGANPSANLNIQIVPRSPCNVDTDVPTVASLQSAKAALQAGGTDVPLTPSGCARYQRTIVSGQITSEQLVSNGAVVVSITHTPTESTMLQGGDGHGFFEYEAVQPVSPAADQPILQITKYSPSTHKPIQQTSWFNQNGATQVTFAEPDSSGTLVQRASYLQGPLNTLAPDSIAGPVSGPQRVATPNAPCTVTIDCSPSGLADALGQAIVAASGCLYRANPKLADRLLTDYIRFVASTNFSIRCDKPEGDGTSIGMGKIYKILMQTIPDPSTYLSLNPKVTFIVNKDRFCSESNAYNPIEFLFHELFHLTYMTHHPDQEIDGLRTHVDQAYACQEYCFSGGPGTGKISQCACAKCLDTVACDPQCSTTAGFTQCNDFGFWCPCPPNLHWYGTCADCLAGCPQGLACFGVQFCIPETANACLATPPPTCQA